MLSLPNCGLMFGIVGLAVMAGPASLADTTYLLLDGELGSASDPSPIDGGTFELKLGFDEPTLPDGERSTFSTPTLVYVAQSWSLALLGDAGIFAEYDQDTNPEALGFAELTGQQGFEDGETFLTLGVDDDAFSDAGPLRGTLVNAEFFAPTLVDTFFTERLVDLPNGLVFTAGSVFEETTSQTLGVNSAGLAVVSIDDSVIASPGTDGGNSGEGDGSPSVVPSPTAAAGGMLLLLGAMARRRNTDRA